MEPVAQHAGPTTRPGLSRVAVIIPTWNEVEAIGPVVTEVLAQGVGQVIVADGNSQDGTAAVARTAGASVINAGRGYGRACHLGAQAADSAHDIIAFMDGDGADCPDQLETLCRPIIDGQKDFTIASRTRGAREPGAMMWHQVMAGALAGRLMGALYGVRYTDMCALRAITRDALASLDMHEMTYGWNIEMQMKAARARLRIAEFAVPYRVRAGGTVQGCRVPEGHHHGWQQDHHDVRPGGGQPHRAPPRTGLTRRYFRASRSITSATRASLPAPSSTSTSRRIVARVA